VLYYRELAGFITAPSHPEAKEITECSGTGRRVMAQLSLRLAAAVFVLLPVSARAGFVATWFFLLGDSLGTTEPAFYNLERRMAIRVAMI